VFFAIDCCIDAAFEGIKEYFIKNIAVNRFVNRFVNSGRLLLCDFFNVLNKNAYENNFERLRMRNEKNV
jgi:hypothetical protein